MRSPHRAPVQCSRSCDDIVQPQHLARKAAGGRARQKTLYPGSVRAVGSAKRIRDEKGAFALLEISVDVVAVSRNVSVEVQDVVSDLEGCREQ
jgi:hypothetical protein